MFLEMRQSHFSAMEGKNQFQAIQCQPLKSALMIGNANLRGPFLTPPTTVVALVREGGIPGIKWN